MALAARGAAKVAAGETVAAEVRVEEVARARVEAVTERAAVVVRAAALVQVKAEEETEAVTVGVQEVGERAGGRTAVARGAERVEAVREKVEVARAKVEVARERVEEAKVEGAAEMEVAVVARAEATALAV